MPTLRSQFPIPILWIYVFSGCSFFILYVLATILQEGMRIQHPGKVIPAIALIVFPLVFFLLHKVGVFAESRGWIYYRRPRTGGLGAGTVLDLEILVSGRNRPVENVQKARESLNEGAQQENEGDIPPEKKTQRHE